MAATAQNATVAWSGGLSPDIVTDISLGTLFGRGSGESIQLKFAGNGWVVVQPYEEIYFQDKTADLFKLDLVQQKGRGNPRPF